MGGRAERVGGTRGHGGGVLEAIEQRKGGEGGGGGVRVGGTSVEIECQGAMLSPPAFPWLQGNSGE